MSNDETKTEKTPKTISQSGTKIRRSESNQSTTLTELNNCIAQFEKFSYFTDENLRAEKDICFSEISNKLNEIKNTLIENKNKQLNYSQVSMATELTTSNCSETESLMVDSILTETNNTPVIDGHSGGQGQRSMAPLPPPPPPPPPMPLNLLDNKKVGVPFYTCVIPVKQ